MWRYLPFYILLMTTCSILYGQEVSNQTSTTQNNIQNIQPNIIIVMADDMGFSDLRCYGGEIQTPNIDQLARDGIRFTGFKNTSRCAPSRASILTGRYQHSVAMGWMAAAVGTVMTA